MYSSPITNRGFPNFNHKDSFLLKASTSLEKISFEKEKEFIAKDFFNFSTSLSKPKKHTFVTNFDSQNSSKISVENTKIFEKFKNNNSKTINNNENNETNENNENFDFIHIISDRSDSSFLEKEKKAKKKKNKSENFLDFKYNKNDNKQQFFKRYLNNLGVRKEEDEKNFLKKLYIRKKKNLEEERISIAKLKKESQKLFLPKMRKSVVFSKNVKQNDNYKSSNFKRKTLLYGPRVSQIKGLVQKFNSLCNTLAKNICHLVDIIKNEEKINRILVNLIKKRYHLEKIFFDQKMKLVYPISAESFEKRCFFKETYYEDGKALTVERMIHANLYKDLEEINLRIEDYCTKKRIEMIHMIKANFIRQFEDKAKTERNLLQNEQYEILTQLKQQIPFNFKKMDTNYIANEIEKNERNLGTFPFIANENRQLSKTLDMILKDVKKFDKINKKNN